MEDSSAFLHLYKTTLFSLNVPLQTIGHAWAGIRGMPRFISGLEGHLRPETLNLTAWNHALGLLSLLKNKTKQQIYILYIYTLYILYIYICILYILYICISFLHIYIYIPVYIYITCIYPYILWLNVSPYIYWACAIIYRGYIRTFLCFQASTIYMGKYIYEGVIYVFFYVFFWAKVIKSVAQFDTNWHKIDTKLTQNWHKIVTKLSQNCHKIVTKLSQNVS